MHGDLKSRVDRLMPSLLDDFAELVRIPSISAAGFDASQVRRSAEFTADRFAAAGLKKVTLLETPGAHPAVFGELAAPPGAPTLLLYAHHDVQPPGPADEWDSPAFEPTRRGNRIYGRGTSDDKAGIIMHLGALRAFDGRPPVGIKILIEGEEEVGSTHLGEFLETYESLLAAEVIVIADAGNWATGVPTLTTSLRGLAECVVEVRTLRHAVHSGGFGGALPDALTTLARLLATLHGPDGEVAVPGLVSSDDTMLDMNETELHSQAESVAGLALLGTGSVTSRIWTKPAISILAVDAPPIAEAINQLVPVARAKVSMRVSPGDDPVRALRALQHHLEKHVEWGAEVTVTPGATGEAFSVDTTGAVYDAFRRALSAAWGTRTVEMGMGGSIPFVADLAHRFPDATILLTGVADPASRAHGPNESQDVTELRNGVLAEAIAFRLLGEQE
jgi:acetylornithine deacetylase/succinyl-diaminopimelate desuccinylase-like protein